MMNQMRDLMNRLSLFMMNATDFMGRSKPVPQPSPRDFVLMTAPQGSFRDSEMSHQNSLRSSTARSTSKRKQGGHESSIKDNHKSFMEQQTRLYKEREQKYNSGRYGPKSPAISMESKHVDYQEGSHLLTFEKSARQIAINPLADFQLYKSLKTADMKAKYPGLFKPPTDVPMDASRPEAVKPLEVQEEKELNPKEIRKMIISMQQCRL